MIWQVALPRAVQLVIDDVGWREGWRLDDQGGPFRAGVDRLLEPADYQAIADLGRQLHIRPTAAMILREWDLHNRCATVPTATPEGAAWDNTARHGDWMAAAAEIVRTQAGHLELALHGVGHEHWQDGVMTRAEYYGRQPGTKWPWEVLQAHLKLFGDLLDDHGLGRAAGHRFPQHFVPCAFCYLWDETDPESTGALIAGAGTRYGSTPFASLSGTPTPLAIDGGVDHGLMVLDRGSNGVPWYVYDTVPAQVMGEVVDEDAAFLADLAAGAPALSAEELELLLARRVAGRAEDRERLLGAHRPLLARVCRYQTGLGAPAAALAAAGEAALARAVDEFPADTQATFETVAEQYIREALQQAVAAAEGGPSRPPMMSGSICGIHWPNLLREDPADNGQAVARWADYLGRVGEQPGQMLAANTRECFAQWAYHTFGRVTGHADGFSLDLSALPEVLRPLVADLPVVVEVSGYIRPGRPVSETLRPVWYRRQGARAFLAVKVVDGRAGDIRFDPRSPLEPVVYREHTANILDLVPTAAGLDLQVEIYGRQTIEIVTGFVPSGCEVIDGRLTLEADQWQPALGLYRLRVRGEDLQGEIGWLRVTRRGGAARE